MVRGVGDEWLFKRADYFKCFRQRGVIIRDRRLIKGRLLFEEIWYFEIWDELSVPDGVNLRASDGSYWRLREKRSSRSYTAILGREVVYAEHGRQYTGQAWMPKSLTTPRNTTSVCHFTVTRQKNHLSVTSQHQGPGTKLPLTSSH